MSPPHFVMMVYYLTSLSQPRRRAGTRGGGVPSERLLTFTTPHGLIILHIDFSLVLFLHPQPLCYCDGSCDRQTVTLYRTGNQARTLYICLDEIIRLPKDWKHELPVVSSFPLPNVAVNWLVLLLTCCEVWSLNNSHWWRLFYISPGEFGLSILRYVIPAPFIISAY
jgi:hypothetical protein